MTANEMANLITDFELCKGSDLQKAANMLRQQADQIEKLVAELDKQGEPVAWISKYSLKDIEQTWELTSLSPTKDDYFEIPLYTAPQTKPLDIREIHELAKGAWFEMEIGDSSEIHSGYEFSRKELFELAKAIEERLGVK